MDPGAVVLLVVVLAPIAFVFGRKLSLWYFRIDEQVALLTEIRDQMRKANGEKLYDSNDPSTWAGAAASLSGLIGDARAKASLPRE